jgi:hypothetical protein
MAVANFSLGRHSYLMQWKFSSYATFNLSTNMEFHKSDPLDNPIRYSTCPSYGQPSMDAQASQTLFQLSSEPKLFNLLFETVL